MVARVPLRSQTRYRPTFNEAEDALIDAATRLGNDIQDQRFRKKFAKLKKKWFEETRLATRASEDVDATTAKKSDR